MKAIINTSVEAPIHMLIKVPTSLLDHEQAAEYIHISVEFRMCLAQACSSLLKLNSSS